jgi:hypothetical protein
MPLVIELRLKNLERFKPGFIRVEENSKQDPSLAMHQ